MILLEKIVKDITDRKEEKRSQVMRDLLNFNIAQKANQEFLFEASTKEQDFIPFMRVFTPVLRDNQQIDWEKTFNKFKKEKEKQEHDIRFPIDTWGFQTDTIRDIVGFTVQGLNDSDPDDFRVLKASNNILVTYPKGPQPQFIGFSLAFIMNNDPNFDTYINFRNQYLRYLKASKIYRKSVVFLGVANMLYDIRIKGLQYSMNSLNIVSATGTALVRSRIAVHSLNRCVEKRKIGGEEICFESKAIVFTFL